MSDVKHLKRLESLQAALEELLGFDADSEVEALYLCDFPLAGGKATRIADEALAKGGAS